MKIQAWFAEQFHIENQLFLSILIFLCSEVFCSFLIFLVWKCISDANTLVPMIGYFFSMTGSLLWMRCLMLPLIFEPLSMLTRQLSFLIFYSLWLQLHLVAVTNSMTILRYTIAEFFSFDAFLCLLYTWSEFLLFFSSFFFFFWYIPWSFSEENPSHSSTVLCLFISLRYYTLWMKRNFRRDATF